MPPANEVENEGSGAGVPVSGLIESVVLHPTRPRTRLTKSGARSRAILRDSLKVYVMADARSEGVSCELRTSFRGESGSNWPGQSHGYAIRGPAGRVSLANGRLAGW